MIEKTEYYDEFIRYYWMAKRQQEECNLGTVSYSECRIGDDLMEQVHLYDVVERKYAGFSQIVHDCFYGWTDKHPYWSKMTAGLASAKRHEVAVPWTGKNREFSLADWLYVFILHRVCGSGINYAVKPSGYHNTILPKLYRAKGIDQMVKMVQNEQNSFYTSGGYQFPAFPKPIGGYKRGGDYFLCEYAPRLARNLSAFLQKGDNKDLREIGEFMLKWNVAEGLRQYKFQYAAIVADIADWFPAYVNRDSMFYYGSNAVQCLSYLAKPLKKMKMEEFLDSIMLSIYHDTQSLPYNAEDVACDFIRWLESYIRPGGDYDHLDLDKVWNSSKIVHPFGRQKAMLELGLVESFNGMTFHPTGDKILKENNLTPDQYRKMVASL